METASPEASTATMESLLRLHDEAFVTSAYRAILGRTPDLGGLQNYLTQVRAGVEKAHILVELARSPEGRTRRLESPALGDAIDAHYKRASSFWNLLFRRISNASGKSAQYQLRRIENQLYILERELTQQNKQLAELFAYVISIAPEPVHSNAEHRDSNNERAADASYSPSLSSNLGRTFVELKAAIALARSE